MHRYPRAFIELAIANQVLCFGSFTLKSGRTSPYFFNAGRFQTGRALDLLGRSYASAISESQVAFDVLFGPAYKGIPLAAATACALSRDFNRDVPYAFNRKETKTHGEGGNLVGAPLAGNILIIDDVITAGTAIREVMTIIEANGAKPAGVVIGLNRQERGTGELSAIQEVEQQYGIPVISIICLDDVVDYLAESPENSELLAQIANYRSAFGV